MARGTDDYADKCCADPAVDYAQAAKCQTKQENYYRPETPPTAGFAASDEYVINEFFTYHPANPYTGPKYETIREAAKYFAKVLFNNVPQGADRTAAIRKLREAVMTANAGIALGGLSL